MFKPLLAAKVEDLATLEWPMIGSPKLDGIRAMVIDNQMTSRTMKKFPNPGVDATFSWPEMNLLDGELCAGPANAPNVMQATTSVVMSYSADASEVKYYVFDVIPHNGNDWDNSEEFVVRLNRLQQIVAGINSQGNDRVVLVEQKKLHSLEEMLEYEAAKLAEGYEGIMLRQPGGPYKFGRSSAKEQTLIKVKKFEDAEATVIGMVQLMHNENAATKDAFGRTKRSSAKAGKVPAGVMGTLVCRNDHGVEFEIGTGFTADDRKTIWQMREVVGKRVKFKFQPHGVKDAPRCPVYIGFREDPT